MSDLTTRPVAVDLTAARDLAGELIHRVDTGYAGRIFADPGMVVARADVDRLARTCIALAADLDATRQERDVAQELMAILASEGAPSATTYTFTRDQLYKALCEAAGLAREFETVHGHDADLALSEGAREVMDGLDAERELIAHGEMDAAKAGQVVPS